LIQNIAEHLGGVLTPVGAVVVMGTIADGEAAPRTPTGNLRPFVVLDFSSPEDTSSDWSITGTQDQMGMFGGAALCISESYMNTIRLVGLVANTLRGYRPTPDCTEIEIYASVTRLPVDALMHPSRFSQTVGFGLSIGATVVP
jgi:hypothetical protein